MSLLNMLENKVTACGYEPGTGPWLPTKRGEREGYPPRLLVHGEKPGDYVLVWQPTSPRPPEGEKKREERSIRVMEGEEVRRRGWPGGPRGPGRAGSPGSRLLSTW